MGTDVGWRNGRLPGWQCLAGGRRESSNVDSRLLLLLLLHTALEITPGANCVPQGCQAPVSNFGILRSHFAELEGSDE